VPSRKRRKSAPAAQEDPIVAFGQRLLETKAREQAERERVLRTRRDARDAARAAADRAAALKTARRDLERAIERVQQARAGRSGIAEADEAWRAAKALVVELESGAKPEWAPSDPTDASDRPDGTTENDPATEGAADQSGETDTGA